MESSGNTLYIVCSPCEQAHEADFGFKLATRKILGQYQTFGPSKSAQQLSAWFGKHYRCGGKGRPDHFVLAHFQAPNSDQPKAAILQNAVNGALHS